jgi:hypothetical protein
MDKLVERLFFLVTDIARNGRRVTSDIEVTVYVTPSGAVNDNSIPPLPALHAT